MERGKRESSWLVIRRCLAIIRRAQQGPASRDDLIEAVVHQEGPEAYGEARRKSFENDLDRVRRCLLVDLYHDRRQGGYVIQDTWLPLLDLPDADLETMAWLEETFGPDSPQHDEVCALLAHLRSYLAPERRAVIERCRIALSLDLGRRDEDEISPQTWKGLTKALAERRRLELIYQAPHYPDEEPRRHVVDPHECTYDATRGHYYLRAYCHYVEGPQGREERRRYVDYRLGRIVDLTVLPDKLAPVEPRPRRYEVVYELTARVASPGVTHQPGIEIQDVEQRGDGSVVVRAETENVFWAARTLLHYGPNCRVVGGPEMVREMQAVVQALAKMYGED